jgi:hypothetical protein
MILYRLLEIKRLGDEGLFNILERLADDGYLENNKKLIVEFPCSRSPRFFQMICSMRDLETLYLRHNELTLEDLAHVFMSCSKITNLSIWTIVQNVDFHYDYTCHLKINLTFGLFIS